MIDIILSNLGGSGESSLGIVEIMLAFFPYIMLSLIIEIYITQVLGPLSIQTLIRVKNKRVYHLSHLFAIFIIVLLFIIFFLTVLAVFTLLIYKNIFQNDPAFNNEPAYTFFRVIINIAIVQFLGAFVLSLFQLLITQYTQKFKLSLLIINMIYFSHFVAQNDFFPLGEHIRVGSLGVKSAVMFPSLLFEYASFHIVLSFFLIIFILNSKKLTVNAS
ncbi:hypothetical protein ACFVVQ_15625 [Paenibacillus chitinolyticus]|uniref:hypothetical protein n=1 Tax=Paenibacillus chitinolyticus TaxID=79263 RepID=UPI0036561363